MNKTQKRQLHIRNKLIAAVAMLLVSSIMMVSTTYAWFTLSTAPEVQGITTTVGANGNLEIALSPASGLGTDVVEGGVGTSDELWTVKNLTWGNLLDLSDASYGLQNITLLPSQLVLNGSTLPDNPLATPVYGNDGRISNLAADTIIGGKANEDSAGYTAGGLRGVRAVGTASTMSEQQLAKNTGMAAIKSNQNTAVTSASASLNANGGALASMLVAHAQAGESDTNNYAEYVDELTNLVNDLENSSNAIGEAIRGMLLVGASSVEDSTEFTAVKNMINDTDVETLLGKSELASVVATEPLATLITDWRAVKAEISAAETAVAGLAGKSQVYWTDASPVLTYLMNTGGDIKIKGYTITDIKAQMSDYNFLLGLARDTEITLGAGSGVYYDIAEIAGNINSSMSAKVPYDGSYIDLENVSIKTTAGSPSQLDALYTGAGTIDPAGGSAQAMIDVYYGYVLDFMFRTNVSGSYLKLQTEGVQRIYSDGTNTQTMGNGSTISFGISETVPANIVRGMVESLQVIFFDPDTKDVYGVAKVTSTNATETAVVGNLELCSYAANEAKWVTVGDVLTGDTADKLCDLSQNTPKALSVMVMLDGNSLTNADILNDQNITGALNLQFSSSATLVPMQNADLKSGANNEEEETDPTYNVDTTTNVSNATVTGAFSNGAYGFTVAPATGYTVTSVSYTMGGGTQTTLTAVEGAYAIPNVTGDLVIYVETAETTT